MIFPISKSKHKALKEIYENEGIKISELMKKTTVAQKILYANLKELGEAEIIREEEIGRTRQIFPNIKSENGKLLFSLIENEKKLAFFSKYKNMKGHFMHLTRNMPKNIVSVLIFGSYARFSPAKESDLDLLFIASDNRKQEIEKLVEEAFVTFRGRVSARFISRKEFRTAKKHDTLLMRIIKEHVCAFNSFGFIEIISDY